MSALECGRAFLDAQVDKEWRFRNRPAYSELLKKARQKGFLPKRREVFAVLDWNIVQSKPRIVISRLCEPERVNWGFLSGLDVVIAYHELDEALIQPLADAILKFGPRRLQAWPLDPDQDGRFPTRYFKIAEAA